MEKQKRNETLKDSPDQNGNREKKHRSVNRASAFVCIYIYIYLYCIRYTYILYTHIVPYPSDIIICTVVSGTLELENFFLYNGRINAKYRSVYALLDILIPTSSPRSIQPPTLQPQKNRFLKKLLKFQPIKSHKCFRGHDTPLLSLLLLCTNTPMISRNRWTRCSYGTRTHNGTKFHFYTFYSSNHQDLTWVRRNYRRNVTTPRTYVH